MNSDAERPNFDAALEAIPLPALHAMPEVGEPEAIPLPSTHLVGVVDEFIGGPAQEDRAAFEQAVREELDDGDLGELDDLDIADLSDVSEPIEPQLDGVAEANLSSVAPDVAAIEAAPIELPAEALVEAAPVDVPAAPAPLVVGWGDLVDAVAAPQAEVPVLSTDVSAVALPSLSPLAGITVPPSLLPPATFTPPAFVGPAGLSADIASIDLGFPLTPPPLVNVTADAHDDPFATPLAAMPTVAPPPAPAKVTATMVMKLDPAEQKRLLEMLLSRTELSPTELSQPPRPADPDEQK